MIIVIDGLSGSGKSSTARAVAEKMDIQYLDSGALYRAVTFIWLEENKDKKQFLEILSTKDIRFEYRDSQFVVYIDDKDLNNEIRTQRVSDTVSKVAAIPEVRRFINDLMRKAVKDDDFIADGRDLGSAVFPDAFLKFYMEASLDIRAKRRYAELVGRGESVSFEEVKENLEKRDEKDTTREMDPLVIPNDAYVINTSAKTFDEQVEEISAIISEKMLTNKNL